jgi:prepilin-type processing-associated H-X9-DG protein
LIELLVVMAILSILMALLLPAIQQGKEKARGAHCIQNLRQFGVAYMEYTNDFDGWFPPGGARDNELNGWIYSPHVSYDTAGNVTGGAPTLQQVRQGLLYPYLTNYAVYKCLGDKNAEVRNFSYSQNAAYQDVNRDRVGKWVTKVMLMCEEQRPDDGCFWYQNSGAVDSRDCLSYDRHVSATNMLFGDGHVKAIPFRSADKVAKLQDIGCFPGQEDRF